MHFLILKENLNKALATTSRNISQRPQIPILSNILIKAEKGQITIASNNLELGILYTIGAKVEKEGEITVPGKLLNDFINTLNTDKIEFILEGTNLNVITSKTKALFSTIPTVDFPSFPKPPVEKYVFDLKKIKESIKRVAIAASIDEGRPVLTGIKTVIKNGKITFTATDGYRLSKETTTIDNKKDELSLILPAQTLTEIMRITQETKADEMSLSIIKEKNQAVFILPDITLYTRLIDGEYPNVEKIIPVSFKTKAQIDRDEFAEAVKTVSLFARNAANIIKIKIEKDGLKLSANSPEIGKDENAVEAKVDGEEVEIAFNYRYLLDVLNNFPDESVSFEISGSLNPGVFKPVASSPEYLHLIMPVRVQN